jgi:sec-independent protein translocase protein TatA
MSMPGATELMAIALVALLIFGPRKLPEIGRTVGQAMREFRRTSQEVMDTIHGAIDLDEPEPAPRRRRSTPVTEEED